MKRLLLPLVLVSLVLAGIWYGFLGRQDIVESRVFENDEAAIAVLTANASKQDIWSTIAHFEGAMDRTKSRPRSYSYYAAALSMQALHQANPLDKQISSAKAEAVYSDVAGTYPDQGLSVLFDAISLARSPEFLKLEDKAYIRMLSAWKKIQIDAADGELNPLNAEALVILGRFLPLFEKVYIKTNRTDLTLDEIKKDIGNFSKINPR